MGTSHMNIGRAPAGRNGLRMKAAAAGALILVAGGLVGWTADNASSATNAAAATTTVERPADPVSGSYADVVARVSPAVVTIRAERRARNISQELPDNPLFREFFGDRFRFGPEQPERREGGLGSGVIVRGDGHVLTNHHVVDRAEDVTIELHDGRRLKAKVVGTDAPSDLAVLKVEASNLPTLTLGDSNAVRVGDIVLAVGNPLGIGQTVTMGIVSAKGRATGAGDGRSYEDFIQIDAPINRGNSGGALVNTRGELIGINSQILSPSGGNIGIGFSIPANMARNVMTQLIENGRVRRGMLGVTIQPVTSDIARSLGLSEVRGALVNDVNDDGPAGKAGVRRGDIIIAVDGEAVRDGNTLRNRVAQLQPGSTVQLTVLRDGKEQKLSVALAELEATDRSDGRRDPAEGSDGFGMTVEPLTRERARQLGVEATAGVIVTAVRPSGRAADAGLRSGDVIEQVDGKAVASADALRAALERGERPALLLVHRGATTLFMTLER